ncbi:restriction endonuclease subunit S [Bifidobacterium catenulatum]|uniref:restriction endonuclease subunit S n=1 Tax=Bifidobacterium catenulatum TaxID=1686 RepID=UPI00138A601C|nr:restriction endonuclease subunit S [Bifidobacterium catenulatum]
MLLTSITVTTSLQGFFFLGIFRADPLIPNLLCIGDRHQRKNVHGTTHEIQRPIRTDNKRCKKTHSLINDYLEQLCQSLFDRFDNDENNLFVKVSDIADVNPRRTLKKGEEALCVEMADLSTTGAFPTDWRTKAYNGGVKFVNGDTILARITPCLENGKAGYINFLEQDEVAFGSTEYIVLTSKGELPSEFFYFLARNEDFISYATAHMNGSSGRQRVSGADVGNYEVRMPSEKQVSEFKEIAGKAMRVISASSIESRKLAQSRDALLPKLMSGEIDVSEVDLTQPTNNHLAGC